MKKICDFTPIYTFADGTSFDFFGDDEPQPTGYPEGEGPRILIAEDNPSNYRLVEVLLRNSYRIAHAWNGTQAVDLFRAEGADLILMDLSMPVMDGYEAFHQIRHMDDKVPIIALTAFAFDSDRQRAIDTGFDGFLAKPISAAKLRESISQILQR